MASEVVSGEPGLAGLTTFDIPRIVIQKITNLKNAVLGTRNRPGVMLIRESASAAGAIALSCAFRVALTRHERPIFAC